MNNDLMLGGGIPNIGGGPKIDPLDYKTIRCSKCGGITFHSSYVLKEIPGTAIGKGNESVVIPVGLFVCDKCGTILDSDVKELKLENDLNENVKNLHIEKNEGTIIIS